MKLTTINIQGNIFTSEILEKIRQDDIRFQTPSDFGLKPNELVRDEISNAWSLVNTYWQIFKQKRATLSSTDTGTSETRKHWILPLLAQLGYEVNHSNAEIVNEKSYAISHRVHNKDGFPIHIVGSEQSLDKKAEFGVRLSPHALVQEYINSTDHIFGFVTNGLHFRVLRDATRLSRLSYLEFNLEQMIEEGHYAEFALFYRLLHASRINDKKEDGKDSKLEFYHNEALASGSRIRERLSQAVERSILGLANGLLNQAENHVLRDQFENDQLKAKDYYIHILRSVYRILFLLVIEERNLIYKENLSEEERKLKDIYYNYYSIQRLTYLVSKAIYIDPKKTDLWQSLLTTFRLFEDPKFGKSLGLDALGSGIFDRNAIYTLHGTSLNNETLLTVFRYLVTFENENHQMVRVNYADLDVEEFGSVYEGLLEYEPVVHNGQFHFKKGDDRSSSGSHYTPEELVKPLIIHSLDYVIAEKLKEADSEKALLSIKVCDVACGSGHILLSAARRIGFELARLRSNEDQPTPSVLRIAIRDVIKNCIYGVDLNPLAVELCKVALWLEAHDPGEPLNFLDHHIKNGNAIVGLAHYDDLQNGIPSEAFKALPDDEKTIASAFKKRNDEERKSQMSELFDLNTVNEDFVDIQKSINQFNQMPEKTSEQIEKKAKAYHDLTNGKKWFRLKQLADLQVAQFFIPKTTENKDKLTTHSKYKTYLNSGTQILDRGVSMSISGNKKFFHWFLEFPEVFQQGGFDCVLGNPPFLGGQKLTGNYGANFLEYLKYTYKPIGAVDLVTYFFRRIFEIIKINGFQSLISTNTISQGSAREGGLDVIASNDGVINHAIRSMKWPGQAAVEVSLISIHKGGWKNQFVLDGKSVERITSYLDDSEVIGKPMPLLSNKGKSFQGSIVLGKGFVLSIEEAEKLIEKDPRNKDVIFPYLNGDDLNNDPEQKPSRWVINFFDWDEAKAKTYPDCYEIIEKSVKPERQRWKIDNDGNEIVGTYALRKPLPQKWWIYGEKRPALYNAISELDQVMVINNHTRHHVLAFYSERIVYSHALTVIAIDSLSYYSIMTSQIMNEWAWHKGSTMGTSTLRYTSSQIFETFPFPTNITEIEKDLLEGLGKNYLALQKNIMDSLNLGITKTYNLFHNKDLSYLDLEKQLNEDKNICIGIYNDILKLRDLQIDIDEAVLNLFEWSEIELNHGFYELEYLPENDRVRFSIHPTARKEILKRLLLLNLEQSKSDILDNNIVKKKLRVVSKTSTNSLFPED
ncbi:Eco57I restriction-modification methylase domain-containing protein [Elizabethkingia occulta]|uniref:Eco57I restriction-modification methylase domain-containing protein n=3 Tax=Elizabethkingia TaxID=308865 RepID=UPI00099AF922|nr:DNA methyltransferase [Elizabethkingia occulta]OPB96464.1 restriction endonuclease [Elizabethkingia occulta]